MTAIARQSKLERGRNNGTRPFVSLGVGNPVGPRLFPTPPRAETPGARY